MSTQDNREGAREVIEDAISLVKSEWYYPGWEGNTGHAFCERAERVLASLPALSGSSTEGQVARDGQVVVDRVDLERVLEWAVAQRRLKPMAVDRLRAALASTEEGGSHE